MILIGPLAGAIISLSSGNTALAAGLGAATLADLIGAGIYKPLDKLRQALVDTQRLDLIHLMAKQELASCMEHESDQRIKCQQQVWNDISQQLATLEKPER